MHSILPSTQFDTVYEVSSERLSKRGSVVRYEDQLVVEHTITVSINEVPSFEIVCSPTSLEDLVLGRLLSEGLIHALDELELLYICQDGLRASVFLTGDRPVARAADVVEQVASCCTGNRTIAELFPAEAQPERIRPIQYRREWIYKLAAGLKQDMPIYDATHGTHSALLMREGEILTRAEDIGRHNALDKVFGWALRNGIPLGECIVYSSGRIPLDMVKKVIRAGVPVFASKAMPTRQAVELADYYGLTLIAGARADSMVLFSREEHHDTD